MGALSLDEVELLQRIARDASRGGSFQERLTDLAGAVAALVPTTTLSAFVLTPGGAPTHTVFWNGEEQTLLRYATHYRLLDPMGSGIAAATGAPLLLSDRVAARRFGRDAYTSDFLGPLGVRWVMGVAVPTADGGRLAIALQRERPLGDFTLHERQLLRLVAPDLAHAAFSAVLLERAQAASPRAGAGGVVLDHAGAPVHADARGAELLARVLARDRRALAPLVAPDAPRTGARVVAGERAFVRASHSIMEGGGRRRQVLVVLEELAPGSPDHFRAACDAAGLTEREREVAALAIAGAGNRGIAYRLCTSTSTVKYHLANVFRKTGAASRTELVHALLGTQPPE